MWSATPAAIAGVSLIAGPLSWGSDRLLCDRAKL